MLIIDELGLSDNDMKRMKAGQTTELEETLAWLSANTAMTLAALSSSSLLDRVSGYGAVSQTAFNEMITRTGFNAVRLSNIMRSSQNIAAAISTVNVILTQDNFFKIKETISPGSSSTVPGTRPNAMVYNYIVFVDHSKLAGLVSQHLSTLPSGIKVAVLCDHDISP